MHTGFCPEALAKVIQRQKNVKATGSLQPVAVVIDDCAHDPRFSSDLQSLFANGRCVGILLVVVVSYVNSLTPVMRANADVLVALRDDNEHSRKQIHREWGGMFDKLSDFENVYLDLTQDFGSCVLTKSSSTAIPESVFRHKAIIRNRYINPRHS